MCKCTVAYTENTQVQYKSFKFLIKGKVHPKMQIHYILNPKPIERSAKFGSQQNIFGASQNSTAALSLTTAVDGDLKACDSPPVYLEQKKTLG